MLRADVCTVQKIVEGCRSSGANLEAIAEPECRSCPGRFNMMWAAVRRIKDLANTFFLPKACSGPVLILPN